MRKFGIDICDIPRTLSGTKVIHHPDGYVIPHSSRNGLPYMDMHSPTDLTLWHTPMSSSHLTLHETQVPLLVSTLLTRWILLKMTTLPVLVHLMSQITVNTILENNPLTFLASQAKANLIQILSTTLVKRLGNHHDFNRLTLGFVPNKCNWILASPSLAYQIALSSS
jgi:hypothetical protein